eukprot:gene21803-12392_t
MPLPTYWVAAYAARLLQHPAAGAVDGAAGLTAMARWWHAAADAGATVPAPPPGAAGAACGPAAAAAGPQCAGGAALWSAL